MMMMMMMAMVITNRWVCCGEMMRKGAQSTTHQESGKKEAQTLADRKLKKRLIRTVCCLCMGKREAHKRAFLLNLNGAPAYNALLPRIICFKYSLWWREVHQASMQDNNSISRQKIEFRFQFIKRCDLPEDAPPRKHFPKYLVWMVVSQWIEWKSINIDGPELS